jgi:hypothetical protein
MASHFRLWIRHVSCACPPARCLKQIPRRGPYHAPSVAIRSSTAVHRFSKLSFGGITLETSVRGPDIMTAAEQQNGQAIRYRLMRT